MKNTILASAMLALSTLGLAACGGEAPAEEADANMGLEVTDARLVLPAVSGNPSAIYLSIANGSDRDVMLREGTVEGMGNYMIHKTSTWNGEASMAELMQVPIAAGETLALNPGEMHLMTGPTPEGMEAGGIATVNLSFVGGKELAVEADVIAAGDDRAAPAEDAEEAAE